jgi:general secretion pathway protein A
MNGQSATEEIPYMKYCGLKEKAFGLTPDPFFYFESASYQEALGHLTFFLSQKEGFALIYGDVGLGKTTMSRVFLDRLDKTRYNSALMLNPIMDEADFLRQVVRELAIECDDSEHEATLEALKAFLLSEYQNGRETVLIIDEAQLLSDELLELIRVLSNFETEKEKILHVILLAQTEIIPKLGQPHLRYLAQRITVIYRLRPLTHEEVFLYINHRLRRAGSNGFVRFKDEAIDEIFQASAGCPRLINILCDRCLLYLYSHSKRNVDSAAARKVFEEESNLLIPKAEPPRPRVRLGAVLGGVLIGLVLLAAAIAYYGNLLPYVPRFR